MPTKVFSGAAVVISAAFPVPLFDTQFTAASAAWVTNLNGDSGVGSADAGTGQQFAVLGSLVDDASVPPAILITDVLIDFDWVVAPGGGTSGQTIGDGVNDGSAAGGSGHFSAHTAGTAYLGGDRAALFTDPAVSWGFAVTATAGSDRVAVSNYTVTITYDELPSAVEPAFGRTQGGTRVTITGSGFTGTPTVTFDGDPATEVIVRSDTTLTARTPAHAEGTVDVVVDAVTFADSFTYDDPSYGALTIRYEPGLNIHDALNDAPNTASLGVGGGGPSSPALGEGVQITDPVSSTVLFTGTALKGTLGFDGKPVSTQLSRGIDCGDLAWRINAKRPHGVYTNVSASAVAHSLIDLFAPGFTGNGIEEGLPNITITFTRAQTFMESFASVATLAGAHYAISDNFDVALFTDEPDDPPDDLTPTSPSLIMLDPQPTLTEDFTQIRNRIWVHGIGSGDSAEGPATPHSNLLDATFTQTTGGALDDVTYQYNYTLVTDSGESVFGASYVSGDWNMTLPNNAFQIDGLDITISADARVIGRNLYRTKSTLGGHSSDPRDYFLVVSLGNEPGVEDSFLDGKADADLGKQAPTFDTSGTVLIMVEDTDAQAELAAAIGDHDDGIREGFIFDQSLVSNGQAIARGNAELAVFARSIKTLRYGTRDVKTKSGKTVSVDLTPNLPIVGDFLIQQVEIDQVNIDRLGELTPRFNVTASSLLFTLDDLLRGLVRSGGGASIGSGSGGGSVAVGGASGGGGGGGSSLTAGDGIDIDGSAITVKLDGATLEKSASGLKVADDVFLRADGTEPLTGNQSAGTHKITNLGAPTAGSTDAATAAYAESVADAAVAAYVPPPPDAIGASVYRSTNQSATVNAPALILFNAETYDPDGSHVGGDPSKLTVQADGKYAVVAQYTSDTLAGAGYLQIQIAVNAVIVGDNSNGLGGLTVQCAAQLDLTAGDYVEAVAIIHESAGTTRDILAGAGATFLQMLLIEPGATGGGGGGTSMVLGEVPTGAIDGANRFYTTAAAFNALEIFLNGLRLQEAIDYETLSSTTFSLFEIPIVGDTLVIDYEAA